MMIAALAGLLFVVAGVSGKPQGYGSYEDYNHGAAYNVIPEQTYVKKVVDYYVSTNHFFTATTTTTTTTTNWSLFRLKRK